LSTAFLAAERSGDQPVSLLAWDWQRDYISLRYGLLTDAAGVVVGGAQPASREQVTG
jgi:hypothetical protein